MAKDCVLYLQIFKVNNQTNTPIGNENNSTKLSPM